MESTDSGGSPALFRAIPTENSRLFVRGSILPQVASGTSFAVASERLATRGPAEIALSYLLEARYPLIFHSVPAERTIPIDVYQSGLILLPTLEGRWFRVTLKGGVCNPMSAELASSNVVVAAHHFNPSILSQIWLVRNDIVGEDQFGRGCLFSDQVTRVESDEFSLLVVLPQMQFVPKVEVEKQQELLVSKAGAIVRALPHTPYSAVGINFVWHVEESDRDLASFTRSLFFDPGKQLYQEFNSEDARFGAYFSMDALGCRMKLDVKPVREQSEDQAREFIQFAFNFHLDLPREGSGVVAAIEQHFRTWDQARAKTSEIIERATG